ncbi:MAG: hypothetical protein HXX13_10905 [Bacteroidetes bacterium]|nr:hypothetical protein [Bacteroidota bacterium]
MKNLSILFSIMLLAGMMIYSGCKKDDGPTPPTLTFKSGTGYITANTSAKYGDTLWFDVAAKSNGTDKLVKFQVYANETLVIDSTIGTQEFEGVYYSLKSILDKEVWKFVTTDIAGNKATDSIVITGSFGEINSYGPITLGAQNNTTDKGFISFSNSTSTTYTMDEAFHHQADIDMFLFYENTASHQNMHTLAAPGSNITGIFTGDSSPVNYITKNVTYFVKTTLTAAQFDAVANDAVILYSFDPNNKFKKAKVLTAGDVYAFMLQSGKYGLLKVISTTGVEDGSAQFSVKIQK